MVYSRKSAIYLFLHFDLYYINVNVLDDIFYGI